MEPRNDLALELPFVTPDLPGCGGELKSSPEDFVVEELPLYAPAGAGEHVYVELRRSGWSTRDLARDLARVVGIGERDVGYAGLKDKVARVTQTFSFAARGDERELARRIAGELDVEVLAVARHANKLRRGHLRGNRFEILVRDTVPDGLAHAQAIAARLAVTGLHNAYGEQRLGPGGANARRGAREIAAASRRKPDFAARFAQNAFQSELFNRWLAERMARGWLERVLGGDVAKKVVNGALFDVLDEDAEAPRAARGEIVATGPIFGGSMRPASGLPGELEAAVLAASGATLEDFARARLEGTRRAARVFVGELAVEAVAGVERALRFRFVLPKGSYATVAMRELMKSASALPGPEGIDGLDEE